MADETATFAVKLQDQVSSGAKSGAQALVELKEQLTADTKALGEMHRAMRQLKGGTSTSAEAIKSLSDKIKAQKESVASSQQAFLSLGGEFGQVKKATGEVTKAIEPTRKGFGDLASATSSIPGPMGRLGSSMSSVGSIAAGGLAAGALAAVAAIIALEVAVVAATAALLKYAVAQSDAARSEGLQLEALSEVRRMYGFASASAGEMQGAIDKVTSSVGLNRGEVYDLATQLNRAGVRGEGFTTALEAAGTAVAALGPEHGQRFARMAAHVARSGGDIAAFAEQIDNRFGGLARRRMLSLPKQIDQVKESFRQLFGGLQIEGFLEKFHGLTQLVSQNTASGRALKRIFESTFQPLLDTLEGLMPLATAFFEGMIIGALDLEYMVLRARLAFRETFGDTSLTKNLDLIEIATWAGVAAFGALAAVVAVIMIPIALVVGQFVMWGLAIARVIDWAIKATDFIAGQDWGKLGAELVGGLVEGITGAAGDAVNAITGLASDLTGAFTGALDIRSPSRVFADLGRQIPAGMAVGVDEGAARAEQAVNRLTGTPDLPGGSGGQTSITFGDIIIQAGGDARETAESFRDELARVLEGVGIELGAPIGRAT